MNIYNVYQAEQLLLFFASVISLLIKVATGTFVTPALMIFMETPIATISVCLPGSIYLIKQILHKCQSYWSDISSTINISKPLSGLGSPNLGRLGNPKRDERDDFTRLTHNEIRVESLSDSLSEGHEAIYHARAYPTQGKLGNGKQHFTSGDAELGFPLQEIHVQNEIDISTSTSHG